MYLKKLIDSFINIWEEDNDENIIVKGWYDGEEYIIKDIELNSDTVYLTFDKD